MSSLNDTIVEAIEASIEVKVDPEIMHFKHCGRMFQCNVHDNYNEMWICDGDFDRWANSRGASVTPCPVTKEEFDAAISFLLLTHIRN